MITIRCKNCTWKGCICEMRGLKEVFDEEGPAHGDKVKWTCLVENIHQPMNIQQQSRVGV